MSNMDRKDEKLISVGRTIASEYVRTPFGRKTITLYYPTLRRKTLRERIMSFLRRIFRKVIACGGTREER